MAGKKSKRAARAIIASRNWRKNQNLREQVREAKDSGRLTESQTEVADTEAYQENRQKARQDRKHRHAKKDDFAWSGTQATCTVGEMKRARNKMDFTWVEGDMAKAARNLWGDIPKDGICMVLSEADREGYIQILYDGKPFEIRAHSLRPIGWVEDEDED